MDQVTLSLEQQFSLRAFEDKVSGLNREQTQQLLVKTYLDFMLMDNRYKAQLKREWKIEV